MMLTDNRYALLVSRANYSCQVIKCLQKHHFPPNLVAIPEYPPANTCPDGNFNIKKPSPRAGIITLVHDIPIVYAPEPDQNTLIESFQQHSIDFILIACWPYLIEKSVYQYPIKAALNLHPSLLPDYRGPDPLNQQIANRETTFGVTLHTLNAEFDQGDIIAQTGFENSSPALEIAELERHCASLGVELFITAMKKFGSVDWCPVPQL